MTGLYKRMLSLLLALLLLFSLAACGSSSSSSSDTEEAEEAEAEEEAAETTSVTMPLYEDPITVTQWSGIHPLAAQYVTSSDDLYIYTLIGDVSGIYFDVTLVGANSEEEQFNLMIAANDYPDIISGMDMYASGISGAIDDEVIIDLYDYVMEYAPNYWAAVSENDAAVAALITTEGQMGTLANLYKETGLEDNGIIIRGDWMESFGIDEIVTYDDLHDYVEAAYLEKGVTMTISADGQLTQLSVGYGVIAGSYSTYDGVVQSYVELDGYYDYLAMLNEWYEEGIIDPDFITRAGQSSLGDLFIAGESSLGTAYASAMVGLNGIAEDPDAVYIGVANPKVSADDEYTISEPSNPLYDDDRWAISTACDPEIIPSLLQLVDYLCTEEGQLLTNYGTEGYTFEYDENGDPVFSDLIINNPDGYSFSVAEVIYAMAYVPGITDLRRDFYSMTDVGYEALDLFSSQNTGLNSIPSNIDAYLTTDESNQYAAIASDVETYMETAVLQFITGGTDLTEESYQEFVDTCLDMGLAEMDELYQAAYDRYLETVG